MNRKGKGEIVVITTYLGSLCIFSHAQGDRWRQLAVISCLVFTSSAKPRGHSSLKRVRWVSNPDRKYGARSTLPAELPRLGDGQRMQKIFKSLSMDQYTLLWIFIMLLGRLQGDASFYCIQL
jgi:hypothetical protein